MTSTPNTGGLTDGKPKSNNEDILKSFRQLNSCITLTSVKNNQKDEESESSNSSEQPSKTEGPNIGEKQAVKKPEDKGRATEEAEDPKTQPDWLKKWSQRCLSISFKKNAPEASSGQDAIDENGPSGSDSGASSQENSRDSFNSESDRGSEINEKPNFRCSKCQAPFNSQPEFLRHFISCNKTSSVSADNTKAESKESKTPVSVSKALPKSFLPPSISIASRSSLSITNQQKDSVPSPSGSSSGSSRSSSSSPQPNSFASATKSFDKSDPKSLSQKLESKSFDSSKSSLKSILPPSISIASRHSVSSAKVSAPSPSGNASGSSRSGTPSPQPDYSFINKVSEKLPKKSEAAPTTASKSLLPSSISIVSRSLPSEQLKTSVQSPSGSTSPRYSLTSSQLQPTTASTSSNSSLQNQKSKNLPPERKLSSERSTEFSLDTFDKSLKSGSSNFAIAKKPVQRSIGRKSTAKNSIVELPCWICKIKHFQSWAQFEDHHLQHVSNNVSVSLKAISVDELGSPGPDDPGEESDNSRESNSNSSNLSSRSEDKGLKLTFKISRVKKRGRGRKKKTVQIINSEGMNEDESEESAEQCNEDYPQREAEMPEDSSDHGADEGPSGAGDPLGNEAMQSEEIGSQYNGDEVTGASATSDRSSSGEQFEGFDNDRMNFGPAAPCEAPSSSYQPQFESFTGDWFSEFESGPRIAAAIAGASDQSGANSEYPDPNTQNKDMAGNTGTQDGLFSQEVLGGEPRAGDDQRQGSFEQLCLNDSYNQGQNDNNMSHTADTGNSQASYNQGQSGDLLSELEYLNNTSQQLDHTGMPQHDAEMSHLNSHGSNSGTPNSSASPSDTSFRALATSPLAGSPASPLRSGYTPPLQPGVVGGSPPLHSGQTPPLSAAASLQQMSQMGMTPQSTQETVTTPRLTIANNLMPTTTSSSLPQMMGTYGSQWPQGNSTSSYQSSYMSAPRGHANLPAGYRPSPPPRIRGRPPLMTHSGRPPMMRGPGRPPGSTVLPPLLPGSGGRGGMMQNLPRMPQNMYGSSQRQPLGQGQKRGAPPNASSPSKSLRREDINVPSRQKDNECQIIAVANRTDGMPVISNVQGGSRDDKASRSSPATTSESTIHLSDSITLSVRQNSTTRETSRSEKGGDAGVVANLLASRGITVTPAAGDKEGGGGSNAGGNERRLPSASDLNLSSAISVHPPTSRDRDGFAVPHPPSSSSRPTVNNNMDRPPRPPTVDLTQEISPTGSLGNRFHCSQCDKTFPSQALLSDHSKVHQQQQQTRMPYKCHLCTAGFSSQKGQQNHYQQFHQIHLSAGDLAIPIVDYRNPVNVQRMSRLGIRSFLPLSNLQNRGAGGVLGIPILGLENVHNGQMTLQQWGITDVLTLGPPKTLNAPR